MELGLKVQVRDTGATSSMSHPRNCLDHSYG